MANDFASNLASQAKSRWRGDEPDAGLTWGSIMTGDSFFDEVEKHFRFTSYTRILEIGPGYGRLLKTLLDRGHPFASFCGVDLSEARIEKLRRQFDDDRIRFEIGDCAQFKLSQSFDIGLCSATFEHLYPSIEQTLVNLRAQIDLQGTLFVDFIMHDEDLSLSRAYFEEQSIGGAYIRIYSLQELEPLFDHAGFAIQAAHPLVLGTGLQGETIRRMLICASARPLRRAKAELVMDQPPAPTGIDSGEHVFDPYRDPVQVPQFRSRFGGLWTDLNNAIELIEGKLEVGMINEEDAHRLRFFVENGYVVLPGAVDEEAIDEFNEDIERMAKEAPPEAWVTCFEDGHWGGRQMKPGDAEAWDKGVKLLDVYTYMQTARRVIFAPSTMRFIKLLFDRPVLAHQSLFFFKGSQQPIHQDTVFVRVSSPMEFVASWTALEDILPGSGELVYYPSSHQFPEFLFGGKYKWLFPGCSDLDRYYAQLHASAQARNISSTKFLGRKGDVFIWSADLAHGGSEIEDPAKTRRSIATHFCPFNTYPMYRHYVGATDVVKAGEGVYYTSEKKAKWGHTDADN